MIALVLTAALARSSRPSPVADAAMRGDKAAVQALLKQGADVNARAGRRHDARCTGPPSAATPSWRTMLVYAGANVGAVTRIGQYTPLHLAAKSGSARGRQGAAQGAAPTSTRSRTTSGATPLHLAALVRQRRGDQRSWSTPRPTSTRKEAEWGQTPLIFAAGAEPRRRDQGAARARRRCRPSTTKVIDVAEVQRARSRRRRSPAQGDRRLRRQGFRGQGRRRARCRRRSRPARELVRSGKIPPPRSERADRPNAAQLQSRRDQSAGRRPRAA